MNIQFSLGLNCNLKCVYCFNSIIENEPKIDLGGTILPSLMYKIINYMVQRNKVVRLSFTGGEPLLYKENILQLLRALKKNSIQLTKTSITTNGTLIENSFLDELNNVNKHVEFDISLDGPPEINNQLRFVKNGDVNLYEKVISKIRLVKKYGFKVYCTSVITRKHIDMGAGKFYKFIKEIDIPWIMGKGTFDSSLAISENESSDFSIELIKAWGNDPDSKPLPWIDGIISYIINKEENNFNDYCGSRNMFVFAGEEGHVWSCPRFIPLEKYCLGAFNPNNFDVILNSPVRKKFEYLFHKRTCPFEALLLKGKLTTLPDITNEREKVLDFIKEMVNIG